MRNFYNRIITGVAILGIPLSVVGLKTILESFTQEPAAAVRIIEPAVDIQSLSPEAASIYGEELVNQAEAIMKQIMAYSNQGKPRAACANIQSAINAYNNAANLFEHSPDAKEQARLVVVGDPIENAVQRCKQYGYPTHPRPQP